MEAHETRIGSGDVRVFKVVGAIGRRCWLVVHEDECLIELFHRRPFEMHVVVTSAMRWRRRRVVLVVVVVVRIMREVVLIVLIDLLRLLSSIEMVGRARQGRLGHCEGTGARLGEAMCVRRDEP